MQKKEIDESEITRNVLWKFMERILAQLVTFTVSLILARILNPNDYGAVAIVLVFINIANIFVSQGFGNALIQKKDADQLDFSSVFYANIVLSLVIYTLLFSFAPYIAEYYHNPVLTEVIRVLGIQLFFAAIRTVQQAYVSRKMIFKKFFWATLAGTITSGVCGLVIAYFGGGVWALVSQYMINAIMDVFILGISIKWKPTVEFSLKRLIDLLRYGWKILVEGFSETVTCQIRSLLIGKIYTSADLGYYTKAQQFPNLIINNVGDSIGAVLFPAMAMKQDNPESVLQLMRKSVRICSYVMFPLFFGMALCSENLIFCLLGTKWMESAVYLKILSFSTLLTVGMYPRHQALKAIGRSDIYMLEHMFARCVGLFLLFSVYKVSVMAIVISAVVSVSILTLIIMYTSKKYNFYNYMDQIKDVLPVFLSCLVMSLMVYIIGTIKIDNKWAVLILQIFVGGVIYFILSIIFKPDGFIFIYKKINIFISKTH